MYLERLASLFAFDTVSFQQPRDKASDGKTAKGETGQTPGPSEVLSKDVPFSALSHRYSSCQLKSEGSKNFML